MDERIGMCSKNPSGKPMQQWPPQSARQYKHAADPPFPSPGDVTPSALDMYSELSPTTKQEQQQALQHRQHPPTVSPFEL